MIDPDKFDLPNDVAFFIWSIALIMRIIYVNKIYDYSWKNRQKYDSCFGVNRLKEILEDLPLSQESFSHINSVEKITWNNFIKVIQLKYPDFDAENLWKMFEKNFKKFNETNDICAILLYDYWYQKNT